ncbi:MAG: hypothetical protein K2J11_01715 [Oscillospiraceae bacterium]|nr:hypothetical protein [Oscillospiraceae bacterium]
MASFNQKNMMLYLLAAANGAKFWHPIYCGFGGQVALSSSALNNMYGYAGITSDGRLVYAKFNMLGMQAENDMLWLENMTSIKFSEFMRMHTIKMTFNQDGKKKKLKIKANEVVHGKDFYMQEQNLKMFMDTLKKYGEMCGGYNVGY